jgi:hypothetical protein
MLSLNWLPSLSNKTRQSPKLENQSLACHTFDAIADGRDKLVAIPVFCKFDVVFPIWCARNPHADAPGMTPDDVKVEVTAGNLVVSGEKSTQVFMMTASCPAD